MRMHLHPWVKRLLEIPLNQVAAHERGGNSQQVACNQPRTTQCSHDMMTARASGAQGTVRLGRHFEDKWISGGVGEAEHLTETVGELQPPPPSRHRHVTGEHSSDAPLAVLLTRTIMVSLASHLSSINSSVTRDDR